MKIAIAQLNPTIGALTDNAQQILNAAKQASDLGVNLLLTPELSLCGYPPRDLLLNPSFVEAMATTLQQLASDLPPNLAVLVGIVQLNPNATINGGKSLFNSIAWLAQGKVQQVFHKRLLPTYDVFDEQRYFESGNAPNLFTLDNLRIGVTICEDLWNDEEFWGKRSYSDNPIADLAKLGVDLIVNLSASPYTVGKQLIRESMLRHATTKFRLPIIYANQVGGNDDLIFDGNSFALNIAGEVVCRAGGFKTDLVLLDFDAEKRDLIPPNPPFIRGGKEEIPMSSSLNKGELNEIISPLVARGGKEEIPMSSSLNKGELNEMISPLVARGGKEEIPMSSSLNKGELNEIISPPLIKGGLGGITPLPTSEDEEIWSALVLGVRDYARKCGFTKIVLGLSGGIDSALVAAIAAEALGAKNVLGVLMPSPYSSDHSVTDALALAKNLGIKTETLPIGNLMQAYDENLADLFTGTAFGIAEENIQSRIRGNLLMAIANKFGYLLISTGNKSEMAVGYCTLYGDMNGGLAAIADVPKTRVYSLCQWLNQNGEIIPNHIIVKPPSAELKPGQVDQDSLPPYDILDDILQRFVHQHQSAAEIIASGHDSAVVNRVIKMVAKAEFKRRQAPPGLKITDRAFGTGWRMPIASKWLGSG